MLNRNETAYFLHYVSYTRPLTKIKMKKSGLIPLVIILSIIWFSFYLPYIEFNDSEHKFRHDNQLIDQLENSNYWTKLMMLTLFYPLLLVIESTFWKEKKNLWKRLILIVQSILIAIGGLYVWFIMSFNIFSGSYDYKVSFYLILVYLAMGSLWNLFLGIPYFDKSIIINWTYNKLSLTKPKLHFNAVQPNIMRFESCSTQFIYIELIFISVLYYFN